ncbi:MAG: formyltetrahydrofolate deformylase [Promicromonosporaceae bacterium]|nr:formyltetrahydrofolate deformylase [Promicromonosporaceae bacterium]
MTLDSESGALAPEEWVLTVACPDGVGIEAAVTGALAARGDFIVQSQQFGSPETGRFFMRVHFRSLGSYDELTMALADVFERFEMDWSLNQLGEKIPTLIMVSKAPHALADLLYRERYQDLPIEVVGIVGNHLDLAEIAAFYGKGFHYIPVTKETKPEAEARLRQLVAATGAELIVLARYMQILSDEFASDMPGQIINIHHSFLPSFKGARPYAQAYERGVKIIGATSHYVTGELDEGPIIEQEVERVDHSRTVADLVALGEDVERRTLARAVRWHAEHRVLLDGKRTVVFR